MEGVFKFAVVMVTALGMPLVIMYVLAPLAKALGRRLEGRAADDSVELESLRVEVEQLRELQPRVAELEERLDFAERLLAREGAARQLPGAGA